MGFEWDESKNKANQKKHGVSFELASWVFKDENVKTNRSDRRKEERYVAVGDVKGRIIAVVYTIRVGNIRIISARKASKNEKREYRKV